MLKAITATLVIVGIASTIALFNLEDLRKDAVSFLSFKNDNDDQEFMKFIALYRRSYGTKAEYEFRLTVFKEHLDHIRELNS